MTIETEKCELVTLVKQNKKKIELLMRKNIDQMLKDAEVSEKARKEGNILYLKKNHAEGEQLKILQLYSKSVATAPAKSEELALAYGNRSAFLFHSSRLEDSINDIDKAVQITISNDLRAKLLCRKLKCLLILKRFEDQSILDDISTFIDGLSEDNKDRETLVSLVEKFEAASATEKLCEKKTTNAKSSNIIEELQEEWEENLDSIKLKFEKKYGRLFIATRDFEPGEIIFTAKNYSTCLNLLKQHFLCEYCLNTCFSGIPCDTCSWAMFCSQNCKEKAMKSYHDLECSVIPSVIAAIGSDFYVLSNVRSCIRLFVFAMKEMGGVEKLKKKVEEIDEFNSSQDQDYLVHHGVKNDFATVYNMSTNYLQLLMQHNLSMAPYSFINIALQTTFFGRAVQLQKVKDLLKNTDLLFCGALFLKLIKISVANNHLLNLKNSAQEKLKIDPNNLEHPVKGIGLAPYTCLINHSCLPNVQKTSRNDDFIVFAIRPIKKNSQLFDNYLGNISRASESERRLRLQRYHITCDCPLCLNGWISGTSTAAKSFAIEQKLNATIEKWSRGFENGSLKHDHAAVKELSEAVKTAIENLPPSSLTSYTLCLLLGRATSTMLGSQCDHEK